MSDEKGCQAPCRYGWDIAGTDWHHHNCPNAKPTPAPPVDGDVAAVLGFLSDEALYTTFTEWDEALIDEIRRAFDRLMARLREAEEAHLLQRRVG